MPLTEKEIFDCPDPVRNRSKTYHHVIAPNIYSAIRVLALDAIDDRYEILYLPQSFTQDCKKSLQRGLKDFKYSLIQSVDKPFLINLFRRFEVDQGKRAALELLEWIKNSTNFMDEGIVDDLSAIHYKIKREKINISVPSRIERYFSFRELIRDVYLYTLNSRDFNYDYFSTKWDKEFYKLQDYDYYGEIENTFEPDDWETAFLGVISGKIAWENACQGNPPDAVELKMLSGWLFDNDHRKPSEHKDFSAMFLTPLLREDYIGRKIINT